MNLSVSHNCYFPIRRAMLQECESSSAIPETHVEYFSGGLCHTEIIECSSLFALQSPCIHLSSFLLPTGEVSCDSVQEQVVWRELQLGIRCGNPGEEKVVYLDLFLECGAENEFDIDDLTNWVCRSPVTIPASDQSAYRIPNVEVSTDYRWPLHTPDACYDYTPVRRRHL